MTMYIRLPVHDSLVESDMLFIIAKVIGRIYSIEDGEIKMILSASEAAEFIVVEKEPAHEPEPPKKVTPDDVFNRMRTPKPPEVTVLNAGKPIFTRNDGVDGTYALMEKRANDVNHLCNVPINILMQGKKNSLFPKRRFREEIAKMAIRRATAPGEEPNYAFMPPAWAEFIKRTPVVRHDDDDDDVEVESDPVADAMRERGIVVENRAPITSYPADNRGNAIKDTPAALKPKTSEWLKRV